MSDTIKRVVAEAMLAKRFETEIHEGASQADIPTLVANVEKHQSETTNPSAPGAISIAIDEDGVPYLANGDL